MSFRTLPARYEVAYSKTDSPETHKTRIGFHLDQGAVVICRRTNDGLWEAWIEKAERPLNNDDCSAKRCFYGATRFKAQCKAARWYGERASRLNSCA
jgi:hypothetical protein